MIEFAFAHRTLLVRWSHVTCRRRPIRCSRWAQWSQWRTMQVTVILNLI